MHFKVFIRPMLVVDVRETGIKKKLEEMYPQVVQKRSSPLDCIWENSWGYRKLSGNFIYIYYTLFLHKRFIATFDRLAYNNANRKRRRQVIRRSDMCPRDCSEFFLVGLGFVYFLAHRSSPSSRTCAHIPRHLKLTTFYCHALFVVFSAALFFIVFFGSFEVRQTWMTCFGDSALKWNYFFELHISGRQE